MVPQLSHFLGYPRCWLTPTSLIRMILLPYTHTSLRFSSTHSIQSHVIIYYPVFQVTEILLFSRSVISAYLQPHGLQHARLPCPSPTPRACSNSYPSSPWCHPTNSSSVVPFSSCLQSSPASGSFLISQLFASGGQSIGASPSVFPMNIQGWFPLGLPGLISLQSKGLSRVFSKTMEI